MNRSTTRLTAAAAALAASGLVLTGCSSGQISQTATQESAVNGTAANVKDIALRNVHLQAEQTSDFLQPGSTVPLVLVAANNSPDVGDKLVSVTSDIGQVALTGDGTIPPAGALVLNAPTGQAVAGEAPAQAMADAAAPAPSAPAGAMVTLSEPITNGLSYNFTFTFEKAGRATVAVPVAAGDA